MLSHLRQQMLNGAVMPHTRGVFYCGPFNRRVNFASQQARALNLVWALHEEGLIARGQRIAVIGAGLAGLTAAAGLARLGLHPTVFEQAYERCHIQRETSIRYAHPSLNFWPSAPINRSAELPVLNWNADIVSEVIRTINRAWDAEFSDIPIHFGARVSDIRDIETGVVVSADRLPEQQFDAAIVAIGFGLEHSIAGVESPSYWENRNLEPFASKRRHAFLICGCGDGAVIEVLRLVYRDFHHGQLAEALTRELDDAGLASMVAAIEKDRRDPREASQTGARLQSLPVIDAWAPHLRQPGRVTLVAPVDPFAASSAPIHRVMLAAAVKHGVVRIERGMLRRARGKLYVEDPDRNERVVDEDVVIVRFGPVRDVGTLLTEREARELSAKQFHQEFDFEPLWPQGYFDGK